MKKIPLTVRKLQLIASLGAIVMSVISLTVLENVKVLQVSKQTAPQHFIANQQTDDDATIKGAVLAATNGSVSFSSTSSYQSNGGVLVLNATQTPTVQIHSYQAFGTASIRVYRVSQADVLNYFLYEKIDSSDWGASLKKLYQFDTSNLTPESAWEYELQVDKNGAGTSSVELPISGTGSWFVQTQSANGITAETMVIRSNLAGMVQKGDNENVFWIQDSGYNNVQGAEIQLFNLEQSLRTLGIVTTGEDGTSKTPANAAVDIAVISEGNDYTIIPIHLKDLSLRMSDDRWYSSFGPRQPNLQAFLFTDRFLYKPGDEVLFKAFIRQDDDAVYTIQPKSFSVELADDQGVIWQRDLSLSSLGSLDGRIPLPADMKASFLSLRIKDGERFVTSESLQVARFRKPDAVLNMESDRLQYLPGDAITIDVTGSYFFGQPISNQEVRYKVYQHSAESITDVYQEIQFAQMVEGYDGRHNTKVAEGSVSLDEDGRGRIAIPAVNATGYRQFWIFHLEYVDAAGTSTTGAIQVLVHPGTFIISGDSHYLSLVKEVAQDVHLELLKNINSAKLHGVRLSARLFRTQGANRLVQEGLSTTTDQSGKAILPITIAESGSYRLDVEATDERNNPIKANFSLYVADASQHGSNGSSFVTVRMDKETYDVGDIARATIQTEQATKYAFVSIGRSYSRLHQVIPVVNGSATFEFPILAEHQPNIFLQASSFYKEELGQHAQSVVVTTDNKEVNISITPSQQQYLPGETATFDIKAVDGTGQPVQTELAFWVFDKSLLQLGGMNYEGIFSQFWNHRFFSIPTNYSYQGLSSSGAEGGGGCFSGETLVTMADGSHKRIDQVTVGDEIQTFASSDSTSIVTAPVKDAYSVKVAGYLILNTNLHVTPEHKLFVNNIWKTAGDIAIGDVLMGADGNPVIVRSIEWVQGDFEVYNLHTGTYHTFFANGVYVHNDKGDARSVFKDTAYWNPQVQTDANGNARVSVQLPDNLTTWVTAAVSANGQTQVGEGNNEFIVTKDVVMRPIFPSFLRVGDRVTLSGLLFNFSDKDHDFTVTAKYSAGTLADAAQRHRVAERGSHRFSWPIQVTRADTASSFQIVAKGISDPSLVDDVTERMPVIEYGSMQTRYQLAQNSATLPIALSSGVDPERVSGELVLSGDKFPQLRSLLAENLGKGGRFGNLFVAALHKMHGSEIGLKTAPTSLTTAIQASLESLNTSVDKESGLWHSIGGPSISASRHPIESLVMAKQAGIAIDEQLLNAAMAGVYGFRTTDQYAQVDQQYLYSLFPGVNLPRKKLEVSELTDPALLARALIANERNGFGDPAALSILMENAKQNPTQVYWYHRTDDRSFESRLADPTVWSVRAMLTLKAEPVQIERALEYLYRLDSSRAEHVAQLALATIEYYQLTNQPSPDFSYQVKLDDTLLKAGRVTPSSRETITIPLSTQELQKATALTIEKSGSGTLFSTMQVSEFFTSREIPAQSHSLKLHRKYLSTKPAGEPTQVGDLVVVEFTIDGLGGGERNITIQDYVPSGLVIIDETLNNGNFDEVGQNDSYVNQEITEQGMILTFNSSFMDQGIYSYKTRVVSEGVFDAPPAVVSLDAQPSIWAASTPDRLIIDGTHALETTRSTNYIATQEDDVDRSIQQLPLIIAAGVSAITIAVTSIILYVRRAAIRAWWLARKLRTP